MYAKYSQNVDILFNVQEKTFTRQKIGNVNISKSLCEFNNYINLELLTSGEDNRQS